MSRVNRSREGAVNKVESASRSAIECREYVVRLIGLVVLRIEVNAGSDRLDCWFVVAMPVVPP